ncbi:MAG: triphosphoribosyl-dephospho-CoA synthase CitG [Lacrimispora sp.]|uniref:triphosphoribosyl-dephospho-CoA synthase CitG n=1 Tax=Lacrimispora sp. TaxID=2719234 RepID=UPI0039E28172
MMSHLQPYPEKTMEETAVRIGNMAYRALLEEVYASPKPGLVDLYSTGAHTDMDVSTFEKSGLALEPYFASMALEGLTFSGTPEQLFKQIRRIGISAEKAMFEATEGVNTHKGMIFHMGILGAAAGACIRNGRGLTLDALIEMEQSMVRETLIKEVETMREFTSHGEKNLEKYGTLGARGEAISGYESVRNISLPILMKRLNEGKDWNLIKLEALFLLMSQVDDSNILARHNPQVLSEVRAMAGEFLNTTGVYCDSSIEVLKQMDGTFIRRNISAGGCADLLAVTIFMAQLIRNQE